MKLSDVCLTDPDLFQQGTPHEMFDLLRAEAPVFWHEEDDGPGFWAITKHADVKLISKNTAVFSSEQKSALMNEPDDAVLAVTRNISALWYDALW